MKATPPVIVQFDPSDAITMHVLPFSITVVESRVYLDGELRFQFPLSTSGAINADPVIQGLD